MKLVLAPEQGEVFDRVARASAVAYNAMVDVFTADSSIYHAMKHILEDRVAAKKQAEKVAVNFTGRGSNSC